MLCVLAENLIYYNLNLSEGRKYLKEANKYKYTSSFGEAQWDSFTNAYISEDPTKNIKEGLLILLISEMVYDQTGLIRKNDFKKIKEHIMQRTFKQYGFNITGSYDNPKIKKIYNAQMSITSDMLQRFFSNYYSKELQAETTTPLVVMCHNELLVSF
tara:strand:- start:8 stop:478 length:471 start_codon:yes stop_codon:yes gene_type:complete